MANEYDKMQTKDKMDLEFLIGQSPRYWNSVDRVRVLQEAYNDPSLPDWVHRLSAFIEHEGRPLNVANNVLMELSNRNLSIAPYLRVIAGSYDRGIMQDNKAFMQLDELCKRYGIPLKFE
jgi:hypothetical protein